MVHGPSSNVGIYIDPRSIGLQITEPGSSARPPPPRRKIWCLSLQVAFRRRHHPHVVSFFIQVMAKPRDFVYQTVDCFTRPGSVQMVHEEEATVLRGE